MKNTRDNMKDLRIERFVLGELDRDESRRMEEAIARDPELASRVREIRESDAKILSDYPPSLFAARIRERADLSKKELRIVEMWKARPGFRIAAYSFGCATALACLFAALLPTLLPRTYDYSMDESILVKGETNLELYRKTDDGSERLADNAAVHKGDRFQLKYNAGNASYGIIFSIDGNGNVTLHFPESDDAPTALATTGETALLEAFELDDAPGFERFFFVFSKNKVNTPAVLAKARELAGDPNKARFANLDLIPGLAQSSLTLVKEGSPK